MRRVLSGCLATLLFLAGCARVPELESLVAPDASRTGLDGTDGPLGAAYYTDRTLARVDDLVRYEVVVPMAGGEVLASDEGLPVVVMIHGGFVEVGRYRWIGTHLATKGYVTVLADHDANLSFLSSGNSLAALEDVYSQAAVPSHPLQGRLDGSKPASVLGHSLGGVAAATLWTAEPDRWDVLAIFASFPAGDTDVEQFDGRPSIHLVGSEDEPEAKKAQGFDRFSSPRVFGVVEGMNHYAWTDDATESELAGDGPALRGLDDVRPDMWRLFDAALDGWMLGDADARARLDAGEFPGVEVER
ncbi:MAG: alpha/beta hydrolase [Deltaproteobacteria bacterium]|nr:alpha/beta hydrolase [Deltaproteobacteria bacterium]